jgi:peptidoglycan/xylan/chitin deacetylase (PgdA/CDA1 family)
MFSYLHNLSGLQNLTRKIYKPDNYIRKHPVWFLVILIVCTAISFGLFWHTQTKTVNENISTETKIIPPGINYKPETASPSGSIRVPVLFYHYVENVQDKKDTIRQKLDITPRIFDLQLKTLKDAGYTFLTAGDLADILDGFKPLPANPVLITFDDGHADFATDVLPILTKYQIRVTAYVISGFIGKPDFMTKNQLKQVVKSGLVEIGSHTVHHISLAGKIPALVNSELTKSKLDLEDNYQVKIVSFAYPNGSFDQSAVDLVKKSGYRSAVSTIPGVEQNLKNRYFLFRLRPGSRTGESLLTYLKNNSFRK